MDEWLTIAQAAQRLGLAERQARRYAARLPDSDRTIDRTLSGRERALIRFSAFSDVAHAARRTGPLPDIGPDIDRTQEQAPEAGSVSLALAMTAQRDALERVIAEQKERIADLQAALDHERTQSRQLNAALAREQMLRALPAPAEEEVATPAPSEPPAKRPWWRFGNR